MNRPILLLILLLGPCLAQQPATLDSCALRTAVNTAFNVSEVLTYEVSFGIISAGEAVMSIPELDTLNSRPCFHIISKIRSSDFFSSFFKVEDHIESLMDVAGLFPWRYEKHIREGKYKADRTTVFDPLPGLAFSGKDTIKTAPYSQDMLSIYYYLRTLEFRLGASIPIDSYEDKEYFPLLMHVKKIEKIKVPAGQFECYQLEPGPRPGYTKEIKGKMWIWISTDSRHLPVKIKTKVSFGSLVMALKKTN
jgi:hypothetical protein